MYVTNDAQVNVRDGITKGAREEVESLWVELQRDEAKGKVILGVCYRSLQANQREEAEADLLSQFVLAARMGSVIMMGVFYQFPTGSRVFKGAEWLPCVKPHTHTGFSLRAGGRACTTHCMAGDPMCVTSSRHG